MTYKKMYAAHEARMWITGIIIPTAIVVGTFLSNPANRKWAAGKIDNAKWKIKEKFKK